MGIIEEAPFKNIKLLASSASATVDFGVCTTKIRHFCQSGKLASEFQMDGTRTLSSRFELQVKIEKRNCDRSAFNMCRHVF
jgi:hypothetical protein